MIFQDWGLIDYQEALQGQLDLVEQVASGGEDAIVFCSHPPVVTLGRAAKPEDLEGWQGPSLSVSRGGRATYHGPSQLVIYPILNLNRTRPQCPARDLHLFLRALELWTIAGLNTVISDLNASIQLSAGGDQVRESDLWRTGVWIETRKIASIGIAVKKWVSYHGIAINVFEDSEAFSGIKACGYRRETMISLEELTGRKYEPVLICRALGEVADRFF